MIVCTPFVALVGPSASGFRAKETVQFEPLGSELTPVERPPVRFEDLAAIDHPGDLGLHSIRSRDYLCFPS